MKITRYTFAVVEPRTPLIGLDLEEPVGFSFGTGEITGFAAKYDEVQPDGTSRRITSGPFRVAVTPEEYALMVQVYSAALERAGVVPPGGAWALAEAP